MADELTAKEKEILKARTPRDYIDRSLKSKLPPGRKAMLARLWMKKTGHTVEDIQYARNRHPYWKAKKMKGTAERNQRRFEEHHYGTGSNIAWHDDLVLEFIGSNKKERDGRYEYRDWELAKHFKCSIASIQHMRRKYNMAVKIIEGAGGRPTEKRLLELLRLGEEPLRAMKRKIKRR